MGSNELFSYFKTWGKSKWGDPLGAKKVRKSSRVPKKPKGNALMRRKKLFNEMSQKPCLLHLLTEFFPTFHALFWAIIVLFNAMNSHLCFPALHAADLRNSESCFQKANLSVFPTLFRVSQKQPSRFRLNVFVCSLV